MKRLICLILIILLTISSMNNTYALIYPVDVSDGEDVIVNKIRFAYDGKDHKPSVIINNKANKSLIPSKYIIKYQNKNSVKPGRYKVYIYYVSSGFPGYKDDVTKDGTITYEIVKSAKTKAKGKIQIKRFVKKTVSSAKKKNINKVLKNSLSEGMTYEGSIYKKLIKKANRKCLKMTIKKIKLSKDNIKATVKIKVKRMDYGKAMSKVETLCYKNAVKDGYFDDPRIMSSYKFNKNMKKAVKKYPPKKKIKTIRVYMAKTYKKGWIVSNDKMDGSKIKNSEDRFAESLCAGL